MTQILGRTAAALLFVAVAMASLSALALDRTDPRATAAAFIAAYAKKDVKALPPLMNAKNQKLFSALAEQGESHSAHSKVFSGWRFEAAQKWSAASGETRYTDRGRAWVFIARMKGDEVAVVDLTNEAGKWAIRGISSPTMARFNEQKTTLGANSAPADGTTVSRAAGSSTGAADATDAGDPAATARAFLTAFANKDVKALPPLANRTNRKFFTQLAEQGENHRAYKKVFAGGRYAAARSWSDQSGETRYDRDGRRAVVYIGPADGRHAVLLLDLQDGKWGVEDINFYSMEDFKKLPSTR